MAKKGQIALGNTRLEVAKGAIDALSALSGWLKSNIYNYFLPHPKQQLFFHPEREKFPRFRVFQGGNRSGKTEAGCLEALAFALGYRPWDGTKTPIPAPNKGRVIGSSYLDGLKKVVEPKIAGLWPEGIIAKKKVGQQGAIIELTLQNGSTIDFLSCEQESDKHEGADRDWIWVDEPLPRDHWIANTRGLVDRGGYAWMTLTPLSEAWILDEVIVKAKAGDPDFYYIQASMYDNVGYGLTEAMVKQFESTLTEEERLVRIHGEFLALQGLVYKELRDHYWKSKQTDVREAGGHIVEPFTIPPEWMRYVGIDPHDRAPTHIVWMAMSENDELFIYDEAALEGMTIKEIADEIKDRENNKHPTTKRSPMRFVDPAAARKSNTIEIGTNIRDALMREGIYCYQAVNDLDAGHKAVRNFLRFEETSSSGFKPRLMIFDTCTGVRHAMQRYTWAEWASAKERQSNAPKPKPTEKFKHYPDCIRYVCVSNPHWYAHSDKKAKKQEPLNKRTGY